jgi:hypothetical protein
MEKKGLVLVWRAQMRGDLRPKPQKCLRMMGLGGCKGVAESRCQLVPHPGSDARYRISELATQGATNIAIMERSRGLLRVAPCGIVEIYLL